MPFHHITYLEIACYFYGGRQLPFKSHISHPTIFNFKISDLNISNFKISNLNISSQLVVYSTLLIFQVMSASIGTRDSTEIIYIRHQLDSYLQALPTFSKEKRAKEELGKASFSRASE